MKPDEVKELRKARESLCRRRRELARQVGKASRSSIDNAEKLTKICAAIEAVDRALNEAGQPYMSTSMHEEPDEDPDGDTEKPTPR